METPIPTEWLPAAYSPPGSVPAVALDAEPQLRQPPEEGIYAHLVAVRNQELGSLWIRFNLHLFINGGLLVAATSAPADSLVRVAAPLTYLFGATLTALWYASERVGREALTHWDLKLAEFETLYWSASPHFRLFAALPGHSVPVAAALVGASKGQPITVSTKPLSTVRTGLRDQSRVSRLVVAVFMMAWITLLSLV